MQKKLLLRSLLGSFVLIIVLVVYIIDGSRREDHIKLKVASQKIEYFTENYFRFTEEVAIDADSEKVAVSISFTPEVGSIPIKEEIYQNVAYHALQIVYFFPEVNQFKYIVLWDDYTKQEVLTLTIGEDEIKNLADIYYSQYNDQLNGLETSYKTVFSSIIETKVSESWRDRVNTYSELP